MTTNQAYQKFIIDINENATTDRLSCDKGRFCVLYNNQQNRAIEGLLEKRYDDDIRYIQKLLVDDYKLTKPVLHRDHTEFPLPNDYFDFSNLYALAEKEKCSNQKIDCFEIKEEDKNNILRDEFQKPSFKYRETPFNFASDKIRIYTANEFSINSAILSYYRYPIQIGLVDPEDPESNFNSNNPEFDDKLTNRIIDLTVSQFFLNVEDQRFQINKANAITKP